MWNCHNEHCEEKEWAGGKCCQLWLVAHLVRLVSCIGSKHKHQRAGFCVLSSVCTRLSCWYHRQDTSMQQEPNYIHETASNNGSHMKEWEAVWIFSEGPFTHARENQIIQVWQVRTRGELDVWRDNRILQQKLSDLFVCPVERGRVLGVCFSPFYVPSTHWSPGRSALDGLLSSASTFTIKAADRRFYRKPPNETWQN